MLTKDRVTNALASHGAWKIRLQTAIETGASAFPIDHVKVDNRCDLGNWLYRLPVKTRQESIWKEVQDVHAQFHKEAARILDLALHGKQPEAKTALEPHTLYGQLTKKLMVLLQQWEKSIS